MGQASALITLSNKLLDLIGVFFSPEAVTTRRRKKIIQYADLLVDRLAAYIDADKSSNIRAAKRDWALVLVYLSKYKHIRKTLR